MDCRQSPPVAIRYTSVLYRTQNGGLTPHRPTVNMGRATQPQMICAECYDTTGIEYDMVHTPVVQHYHDPSDAHGHGEQEVCAVVCPNCQGIEDCDSSCKEPFEE